MAKENKAEWHKAWNLIRRASQRRSWFAWPFAIGLDNWRTEIQRDSPIFAVQKTGPSPNPREPRQSSRLGDDNDRDLLYDHVLQGPQSADLDLIVSRLGGTVLQFAGEGVSDALLRRTGGNLLLLDL
jgi:hypothetical protein